MKERQPLRKVLEATFSQGRFSPPGSGRYWLKLECGHWENQKASIPVPNRRRCYWCTCVSVPSDSIWDQTAHELSKFFK